jgi:hypothetical protein
LLFFAFQPTKIAWQYGYDSKPVNNAYRNHKFELGFKVTKPTSQGRIQILEDEETILRSLKYDETLVIMRRLTRKKNCPGMARRLAWKVLNPNSFKIKLRYVLGGEGGM